MHDLRRNWLAMLDDRLLTVNHINELISQSSLQGTVPLEDLGQWMQYIEADPHLCHRLGGCSAYEAEVVYINGLPYLSLILIYNTLIWSLGTAQCLSTGIVNPNHCPSGEEQRMELCLFFEECPMQHGPNFLHSIIKHSSEA